MPPLSLSLGHIHDTDRAWSCKPKRRHGHRSQKTVPKITPFFAAAFGTFLNAQWPGNGAASVYGVRETRNPMGSSGLFR